MSTRCTISHSTGKDDYHLFEECFEKDNVHLELRGKGWSAEMKSSGSLLLSVDVSLFRKIVEGWTTSRWGRNPSWDHKLEDEYDEDALLNHLESASPPPPPEVEELRDEIKRLRATMLQAALEIEEHWDSHCDDTGAGPMNLVRRLRNGKGDYREDSPATYMKGASKR